MLNRLWIYPHAVSLKDPSFIFLIAEIFLLGLAVIITAHLVELIQNFELLQDKLLKPTANSRIKFIKNNLEEINAEFYRCRRYNHTLALLAIEPTPASLQEQLNISKKSERMLVQRFITLNLSEVIAHQIRQFDMVLIKEWTGRFYILCPENNAEGTKKLAIRLNKITEKSLGISIHYAYVIFPQDALTLDELVNQADYRLKNNQMLTDSPEKTPQMDGSEFTKSYAASEETQTTAERIQSG